jgi:ADP-ribose pyrophosphatase YjhB (NUDIX family)
MLRCYPFDPDCEIVEDGEAPPLPARVDARVRRLWEAEQKRRGAALFNGRVFSVEKVSRHRVSGCFVEFARYVAQRRAPRLYDALVVRPLAVTGLLRCADGVVFGRRLGGSLQDPDCWELVPSGFVDPSARHATGALSLESQLLRELEEEVGIESAKVAGAAPFCVVEDPRTHIIDVGIELHTALSGARIRAAHGRRADDQYSTLTIVPENSLPEFLCREGDRVATVSRLMLTRSGAGPA